MTTDKRIAALKRKLFDHEDDYVDAHEAHRILYQHIPWLLSELERTRKALGVAKETLEYLVKPHFNLSMKVEAKEALIQIKEILK